MRMISLLAGMLALSPALGSAQTMQDLIENKNSDNVLVHSGGYDRKTYSPLSQINRQNIRRLVPVWSSSLMNDAGELSEPAVYNGVMYVINGKFTFAIDLETGRQIWRTPVEAEAGRDARRHVRRVHPRRRRCSTTASSIA